MQVSYFDTSNAALAARTQDLEWLGLKDKALSLSNKADL